MLLASFEGRPEVFFYVRTRCVTKSDFFLVKILRSQYFPYVNCQKSTNWFGLDIVLPENLALKYNLFSPLSFSL